MNRGLDSSHEIWDQTAKVSLRAARTGDYGAGTYACGAQPHRMMIPGWAGYYIDYRELKFIIKSCLSKEEQSESDEEDESEAKAPAEAKLMIRVEGAPRIRKFGRKQPERDLVTMARDFFTLLEADIDLAEAFYKAKCAQLRSQLNKAKLLFHNSEDYKEDPGAKRKAVTALAHHINHDINQLVTFVELNILALRKIVKKYSKTTKQSVREAVTREAAAKRGFMKPTELLKLRSESDRFLTRVNKTAYRAVFSAVV